MCQHCLQALDHESLRTFLWHHWLMVWCVLAFFLGMGIASSAGGKP